MKMCDARIAWNSDSNEIFVTHMDFHEPPESKKCGFTGGACYVWVRDLLPNSEEAAAAALKCALHCLITYRVEPLAVLKAFMEIDEFRAELNGELLMREEQALDMLEKARK